MAWSLAYCTSDELFDYNKMSASGNEPSPDEEARADQCIGAASRAVDLYCGRQFGKSDSPEARLYTAHWDKSFCTYVVEVEDLFSMSGVAVTYDSGNDGWFATTLTVTALPLRAVINGLPYTELMVTEGSVSDRFGAVKVTGSFGWAAVPTSVKLATMMQANRWFHRADSPYGIFGGSEFSEGKIFYKVDPDVESILRPYRRVWGAR